MSSPLLTAATFREATGHERAARPAGTDLRPDLDLSALEQQFFVEWEVPQPDETGATP